MASLRYTSDSLVMHILHPDNAAMDHCRFVLASK